jgi:hypothetical protein
MDRKVLFAILIYYGMISLLFFAVSDLTTAGYSQNISINSSGSSDVDDITEGSFMGAGLNLGRFIAFITLGVGLPEGTPLWFSVLWAAWQTILSVLILSFIINSIWGGG